MASENVIEIAYRNIYKCHIYYELNFISCKRADL